jgi:ribosomal protein S27AE
VKEDEHTCKQEDVDTAKLISTDSRNCPKCATTIFKIDGCDQMWCTQCHTAFSWSRGTIETRIHNPHYYEWLRLNGGNLQREIGDVECGRELHYGMISKEFASVDKQLFNNIQQVLQACDHIEQLNLPLFRVNPVVNNEGLRIAYMRKQIDKATFRYLLYKEQKKHEKKQEVYHILQLFIQAMTDIMFRIKNAYESNKKIFKDGDKNAVDEKVAEIRNIWNEINTLVTYINSCFDDVSKTYNCVSWRIDMYSKNRRFFDRVLQEKGEKGRKGKKGKKAELDDEDH